MSFYIFRRLFFGITITDTLDLLNENQANEERERKRSINEASSVADDKEMLNPIKSFFHYLQKNANTSNIFK
jgi:hypothetical protein